MISQTLAVSFFRVYVGGIAGIRTAKKPALADICNWIMWQLAEDPTPSAAMICKVSNNS
jgi:hypothetical protein